MATFRPNKPNLWWFLSGNQAVPLGGALIQWDSQLGQEGWVDNPSTVATLPKDGHYLAHVFATRAALGSSRAFALELQHEGAGVGCAWSPVRAEAMLLSCTAYFDATALEEVSVFTRQLPDAAHTINGGAQLVIARMGPKRWT